MTGFAIEMSRRGFTLRSGGADGADMAFQNGCTAATEVGQIPNMEIYLPWKKFNGLITASPPYFWKYEFEGQARVIAERIHPAWDACSEGARKLHTRNVFQVLGRNLATPSNFLVCWTLDGKLSGGTRTAIVLADEYDVPVFNIAKLGFGVTDLPRLLELVEPHT